MKTKHSKSADPAREIDGEFLALVDGFDIGYTPIPVYRVTVTPRYGNRLVMTVWGAKDGNRVRYAARFGAKVSGNSFRGGYSLETVLRSANYRARRYAAAYRKPRGIPVAKLA